MLMYLKILLSLLCCSSFAFGQQLICSQQDSIAVTNKLQVIKSIDTTSNTSAVVGIGKTFLGTSYVAKTLEVGEKESLVVNLHGLDCTTFIENVLALALVNKEANAHFTAFTSNLEKLRYRDGKLNGYGSRLHYFTEWIRNNEKKGIVEDITASLGGEEIVKPINFMSTHRELYPFLQSDANFEGIQEAEKALNSDVFCNLPQEKILAKEHLIQSGDIIALTTSIKGLDVTHTGIATREKDGRIHLLHASTTSGQVEVSKLPLVAYLKKIKGNIGITVARPIF